ncbi:efflux RND transporter periplasmic adaptor subunit [Shewanella salipaludis]|uniref:HlyD family efflux transporter periplasmic adaptor subunit n=1 Tax=Shewanella salipaludis TaxID=2723052 RepID=A0A972FRM3_9GAMM|nr:HlyD family efflux transporter periplasmic adaptor subunit [Shewanella salipaludis]NMH64908.1 HlyD family efflux transporter periplasmic adaptor subunit [Shewanella salipaludis]
MIKDTSGQDKVLQPGLRRRLKLPLLVATATVLVSALVWAGLDGGDVSKSVDGAELKMATLTRGTLVRDIATTGKIVAANAPILYSTEEGTVTLLSQPGDMVAKGDVLANIASPKLTSNLRQQQAVLAGLQGSLERAKLDARREQLQANKALDMARVDMAAADRESRRGEQLIQASLISKIDYEKGKDELHKAGLMFKHAEQEAALMKDTLSFELKNKALEVERQALVVTELQRQVAALDVQAPVDGIIGNWLTEQKARISAGQPILTVVDLSAFEAELAVPESYADELGLGMDVELSFGGETLMGQLASISPEVRNREVTARVRFAQDSGLKLRQNQRLSARVLLENRANVLMVRRGAFVTSGGGELAYVVEGDVASRTRIKLGARSMSDVEVLGGGQEGDVWVISSLEGFGQAQQVRVR